MFTVKSAGVDVEDAIDRSIDHNGKLQFLSTWSHDRKHFFGTEFKQSDRKLLNRLAMHCIPFLLPS